MTKREICLINETIAYYSGLGGIELKHVEHSIDDYLYCVSGAWRGYDYKKYHKLKIRYDSKGTPFVKLNGYKIVLDEFISLK